MNLPYKFRILAALPGHDPVELFRASRNYAQADWNYHTRDLSPEWACWVEHTLADRDCISDRPVVRAPHVAANAERARLYPVNPHQELP